MELGQHWGWGWGWVGVQSKSVCKFAYVSVYLHKLDVTQAARFRRLCRYERRFNFFSGSAVQMLTR